MFIVRGGEMKILLILMGVFFSGFSFAKSCQIDRVASNELILSSKYRSQATTAFSIDCDTRYAIQFNSRNLINSNGSSFVVNDKNHKLRTQMQISGGGEMKWNTPISRNADAGNLVVSVRLQEMPTAITPAGTYTDALYVSLIY